MKKVLWFLESKPASPLSQLSRQFFSSHYCNLLCLLREVPKSLSCLRQIHAVVITTGLLYKSVLGCRLIGYYGSLSGPYEAQKVFDRLSNKTSSCYSYMIHAYVNGADYKSALKLYTRLLTNQGVLPCSMTFTFLLKSCMALKCVEVGKLIHAHILMTGTDLDLQLMTDLICFYSKFGHLDQSKKLFNLILHKDVIAWASMIDGLFHNGLASDALSLFSDMKKAGLKANIATWNIIIRGLVRNHLMCEALGQFNQMQMDNIRPDKYSLCAILPLFSRVAILKSGLETHGYAVRNGFGTDLYVATALVDLYAKCGKLEFARNTFNYVSTKDTGLWNAMIVGYGMHGECVKALNLFEEMKLSGVCPNAITFTSILSACGHAGFVNEGNQIFELMIRDYRYLTSPEHYACVVDLFARAGLFTEAVGFIEKMQMFPSKEVWGALLSSCRTHSNVELAEVAIQNMHEMTSTEAGYHIVMANIYAENGTWETVARLRTQIRDKGLKKTTGFSWIEVNGVVHLFDRANMSHPQANTIYNVLWDLQAAITLELIL